MDAEMTREEVYRRAMEWYETKIRAEVEAGNKGKFLVIDVATGEYEVDADEVAALKRIIERLPEGRRLMMRIGYRTAYSLGGGMVEA